jgi:hypothetical protein
MLVTLIALGQTPVYLPPLPSPLQDPTKTASKLGTHIWNIKGWSGMAISDKLPLFWQKFDTCLQKQVGTRTTNCPLHDPKFDAN